MGRQYDGEFLGISTLGFDIEFMRKFFAHWNQGSKKGQMSLSKWERELKKLECTTNNRGQGKRKSMCID